LHSGWHDTCRVDDRALDHAPGADAYVGKDHRTLDIAALLDAHVREQQRLIHVRTGDDAAARDDGVHGHAAATFLIEHELRGRILPLISPDGPLLVVDVELGIDVHELHVRVVERID